MSEIIGQLLYWLIPLALIALVFWAVVRDRGRLRNRTPEQFERDIGQARSSLVRAGMLELDRFVGNEQQKRAAVEYLRDEQQGMTKTGGKDDDAERTAREE